MATPEADIRRLTIARRVIYVLVAATIIVPYFVPLPIPFEPDPWARKLYDKMDELPPGSHVLLAFDYDPSSRAELYPMSKALLRHCFKKDLIPIVMTHWFGGLGLFEELCVETAAESKQMWGKEKISGRDYVFLGYKPGYTNLVLNMGQNLKGAFRKDYFDKPTQGMAALKGVDSLKDIDLGIDVAAGATVDQVWIPYGSDRFGFPLGAGCTGVSASAGMAAAAMIRWSRRRRGK